MKISVLRNNAWLRLSDFRFEGVDLLDFHARLSKLPKGYLRIGDAWYRWEKWC